MASYQIVTDSTSDLTPKLVEELGVEVIPMEFILGDEVYHNYPDAREMSSKEFYARLRAGECPRQTRSTPLPLWKPLSPSFSAVLTSSILVSLPHSPVPMNGLSRRLPNSSKSIRSGALCRSIRSPSPWARAFWSITPL